MLLCWNYNICFFWIRNYLITPSESIWPLRTDLHEGERQSFEYRGALIWIYDGFPHPLQGWTCSQERSPSHKHMCNFKVGEVMWSKKTSLIHCFEKSIGLYMIQITGCWLFWTATKMYDFFEADCPGELVWDCKSIKINTHPAIQVEVTIIQAC